MSLTASLYIASGEINNLNSQLALVSHNIANANTPDYVTEDISQTSLSSGGVGFGAVNGTVTRAIDRQTQADLFDANGTIAGLQTRQAALQQIDAVQGAVAGGGDIGSLLGKLQDAFTTLESSPSDQNLQRQVVGAATTLTVQINTVSDAIGAQRQAAQSAIVSGVTGINAALSNIGALSDQVVQAKLAGRSTADLENQRDAVAGALSQVISVKFQEQANGDLLVTTSNGLNLPTHGPTAPLSTAAATLGAGSSAANGTIPPILFGGRDVSAQLTGGSLGANLALRDHTLPTAQANLDEFAHTLSTRFAAQGLTLFTDANGAVPAGGGVPAQTGYVGLAGGIKVNAAVSTNPSLVRDGTDAIVGSPAGASDFTPNPAGGSAGFTTLIQRVLGYSLGREAQAGVAQPAPATGGLGVDGTLSADFPAPGDLAGFAAAVTGSQAQKSAQTTSQLGAEQAVQTTLQAQLSSSSAVSVDTQLSRLIVLQNAYGANAHVISAVQSLFSQLLQAVQ